MIDVIGGGANRIPAVLTAHVHGGIPRVAPASAHVAAEAHTRSVWVFLGSENASATVRLDPSAAHALAERLRAEADALGRV